MARTLNEIRQTILDAKAAEPALDVLNSPSQAAIWRLWVYVVAAAIWLHEQLWDIYKAEVQTIADRAVAATLPWYVQQAKLFQWSATTTYYLLFDPDTQQIRYNIVAPADRIVAFASAVESGANPKTVILKVAQADGSGNPTPLPGTPGNPATQLGGITSYIRQIKPAGIQVTVVSRPPDLLNIQATVWITDASNQATIQTAVEAAIVAHIRTAIPFDGVLFIERLRDAMQAVAGVADVALGPITAHVGLSSPLVVGQRYESTSGYFAIDPAHPLSTTITYALL